MTTENNNLDKFMEFLDDKSKETGNNPAANLAGKLRAKIEEGKDERARAATRFPVMRPADWEKREYVQLGEILEEGCKSPSYDDKGYAESRPVFNYDTKFITAGSYDLVSPARSLIFSGLYSGYIDEPSILFKEGENRILFFLPRKNESLAIKGSGITTYRIKDELRDSYFTEFIYLMMKNENFASQFIAGMNNLSLPEGWIPKLPLVKQKEIAAKIREETISEVKKAHDILKS